MEGLHRCVKLIDECQEQQIRYKEEHQVDTVAHDNCDYQAFFIIFFVHALSFQLNSDWREVENVSDKVNANEDLSHQQQQVYSHDDTEHHLDFLHHSDLLLSY